ncbi:unnamed protein product, partial [Polarella glacialis]
IRSVSLVAGDLEAYFRSSKSPGRTVAGMSQASRPGPRAAEVAPPPFQPSPATATGSPYPFRYPEQQKIASASIQYPVQQMIVMQGPQAAPLASGASLPPAYAQPGLPAAFRSPVSGAVGYAVAPQVFMQGPAALQPPVRVVGGPIFR